MKLEKIAIVFLFMFACLLVSSPVYASETHIELNTFDEIHNKFIDLQLIKLDNDGKLVIDEKVDELVIDSSLLTEYKKKIEAVNFTVDEGINWYDENLQIQSLSAEEIEEKVYQDYQKRKVKEPQIIPMAAYLDVKSLVARNYNSVENVLRANGVTKATAYWVGKVKPKGAWDYKSVSGFSPWNKTFTMKLPNGATEIHNRKWLGNYNYGYTGRLLFDLKTLLNAGNLVSKVLNGIPDDYQAKEAITRGFNHGIKYE